MRYSYSKWASAFGWMNWDKGEKKRGDVCRGWYLGSDHSNCTSGVDLIGSSRYLAGGFTLLLVTLPSVSEGALKPSYLVARVLRRRVAGSIISWLFFLFSLRAWFSEVLSCGAESTGAMLNCVSSSSSGFCGKRALGQSVHPRSLSWGHCFVIKVLKKASRLLNGSALMFIPYDSPLTKLNWLELEPKMMSSTTNSTWATWTFHDADPSSWTLFSGTTPSTIDGPGWRSWPHAAFACCCCSTIAS